MPSFICLQNKQMMQDQGGHANVQMQEAMLRLFEAISYLCVQSMNADREADLNRNGL